MSNLSIISNTNLTMSSREIAELVDSRHDKVKQSIERLVDRGVIVQPPTGDEPGLDAMGRPRVTQVYVFSGEQGKRDSIVVVAQLSPEFTARLVDRWQELEARAANPQPFKIPQTLPEALRLAADESERADRAESALAIAAPKADALDRIATADGSLCLTDAAKELQVRPKDLIAWLSCSQWIYKRAGSTNWIGYQERIQSGLLEHKANIIIDAEGRERVRDQVRVTGKGLARLATLMQAEAA
jgi:phage regulator Rha-like protein